MAELIARMTVPIDLTITETSRDIARKLFIETLRDLFFSDLPQTILTEIESFRKKTEDPKITETAIMDEMSALIDDIESLCIQTAKEYHA